MTRPVPAVKVAPELLVRVPVPLKSRVPVPPMIVAPDPFAQVAFVLVTLALWM